jgi:hypothetical protein
MAESQSDDFYVGYLPAPQSHRRFLFVLVPIMLGTLIALASVLAASQRDPGGGVWETEQATAVEGVLRLNPYPVLLEDGDAVLLVDSGKIGSRDRVSELDGHRVRAEGYLLRRDGRRMLELLAGETALVDLGPGSMSDSTPTGVHPGVATFFGEIVDSKCYHGAMKPGDGKSHKACAILCIRGGIPPVLITYDEMGVSHATALAAPDGGPLGEWLLQFVGEPVEVRGALVQTDGQAVLHVEEDGVRRTR